MPEKVERKYAGKRYSADGADENRPYERKTKTATQALSALMRLCAKSEKSSGDALRLMRGWGVEISEQQGVLLRLLELKFIDDRRYAEAYVREKTRFSGWGAYKIRRMLSTKGIAREIIEQALGQIDKAETRDKLEVMIGRKMRSVKAVDAYTLKGKLVRYGMSLGYDYEDVLSVVERIIKIE